MEFLIPPGWLLRTQGGVLDFNMKKRAQNKIYAREDRENFHKRGIFPTFGYVPDKRPGGNNLKH
jgi:hypothetical protein